MNLDRPSDTPTVSTSRGFDSPVRKPSAVQKRRRRHAVPSACSHAKTLSLIAHWERSTLLARSFYHAIEYQRTLARPLPPRYGCHPLFWLSVIDTISKTKIRHGCNRRSHRVHSPGKYRRWKNSDHSSRDESGEDSEPDPHEPVHSRAPAWRHGN